MSIVQLITLACVAAGLGFYVAGTVGLLRFPDPHSRLHALTKADNLGLGLVAAGLALQMPDLWSVARLALVWLLAVFGASTVAQLVARAAMAHPPGAPEADTGGDTPAPVPRHRAPPQ